MISSINLFFTPTILQKRIFLKSFIEKKIREKKKSLLVVNYYFCDEKEHLKINREALKHDYNTDIITFSFNIKKNVGGDIYINIDEVKKNAMLYNCSFKEELHRVIFHGILHLLDYNDKTEKEKQQMRKTENRWIKEYQEYVL